MNAFTLQYGTYERRAYAKINTYLEVLQRREDGYHELCSHMQLITLHDTLRLTAAPAECDGISLSLRCDLPALSCGEDNLILRAARAYLAQSCAPLHGVSLSFELEKRIPMQGGLAGGSADAAAALLLLNEACGEPVCEEQLCSLGATLGADIPFCIRGLRGPQTARGIGERMTDAPGISDTQALLIVLPGTAVSTPQAFRHLDELYGDADASVRAAENERRYASHLAALESGSIRVIAQTAFNRFEEAVFALQPRTAEVAKRVNALGAIFTQMSGSGPTLVGYFSDVREAQQAREILAEEGISSYVCHAIAKNA